jgi:hypothetical protein
VAKVRVTYGFADFGDVDVGVFVEAEDEDDAKLGRYESIICDCEAGKCKASRLDCAMARRLFV